MTEATGSIGEEAAKLLEAVQEWARRNLGDTATAHIATGAAECTYCPICQLIAVLRGDRPEVNEKIAVAGAAVVTALRSLLDAATGPAQQPDQQHEPRPSRVQRIDLDESGE